MAKRKIVKLDVCANCQEPLEGENYCPNCGQKNSKPDLHLAHFLGETLSNFFAFDNKFFTTLLHLFKYPGRVSRDFIEGKRMMYMHPMRIYLVASFILLFVVSLDITGRGKGPVQINNQKLKLGDELSANEIQKLEAIWKGDSIEKSTRIDRMMAFTKQYPSSTTTNALDSLELSNNWRTRLIYETGTKYIKMDSDRFSEFFMSKMLWVLFIFVPFLALWLKLLYIRRGVHYVEHLFFGFYTQAAFFLLLVIGLLLVPITNEVPLIITILCFSVYLFIALQRFYEQSFRKTLLKFVLLNIGYALIFICVTLASALISYIVF
jgi:hypothetical protein